LSYHNLYPHHHLSHHLAYQHHKSSLINYLLNHPYLPHQSTPIINTLHPFLLNLLIEIPHPFTGSLIIHNDVFNLTSSALHLHLNLLLSFHLNFIWPLKLNSFDHVFLDHLAPLQNLHLNFIYLLLNEMAMRIGREYVAIADLFVDCGNLKIAQHRLNIL